jgi:hypothetical protein
MSSSVTIQRAVKVTYVTKRRFPLHYHMSMIARYAGQQCVRFIVLCQSISRLVASTLQTSSYAHLWISRVRHALNAGVIHMFDTSGTLTARAFKGSERAASRIARSVAIVIGISLSMQSTAVGIGSIDPYTNIKELADYQLTDKQYNCHNEIVFRESSFRIDARNGSHHGYYQIRNKKLINAPYDYQFYFYWKYVQHRYGITKYDEPDYCKALHHLKVKGWQ